MNSAAEPSNNIIAKSTNDSRSDQVPVVDGYKVLAPGVFEHETPLSGVSPSESRGVRSRPRRTVLLFASSLLLAIAFFAEGISRLEAGEENDVEAPEITVVTPHADGIFLTRDRDLKITVRVVDAGEVKNVVVGGQDGVEGRQSIYTATVPVPEDGENKIEILAVDAAGNEARDELAVWLDSKAPMVTLSTPVTGETIRPGNLKVRGTVRDREPKIDRGSFKVMVNGTPAVVDGSSWEAMVSVEESTKTLRIEAEDEAGNPIEPIVQNVRVKDVPREFEDFTHLRRNAHGYDEYRHDPTGIVMVLLPGGTFWMGTPLNETGSPTERPRHKVTLNPFLIAKYEVSHEEWQRALGYNPSNFRGRTDLPVEQVSWFDCEKFCLETDLSFPTEAQWEYACRAGTETPFSFGTSVTDAQMNFDARYPFGSTPVGEYRQQTLPVSSFLPNQFGVHNMHGNVLEWCADIYADDFYKRPDATKKNPLCLGGSKKHVVRGGSWTHHGTYCRSAFRHGLLPSRRNSMVGFRPAFTLKTTAR